MSGNEQKYIKEAFDLNWIAPLGNNVNGFEEALSDYNKIKHTTVMSSGTAAIHLALKIIEVEPQDHVFLSSLTFVATANPVLYEHATPVFIDSEPDSWNMSPLALERALQDYDRSNQLPKAVIVVNLYGQSAKMDEIMSVCNSYNVPVIEDAAESLGSEYKNYKSGTFGHYGIYSFNGNKIITTSGGGALVSDDEYSIQKARFLSTQARDPAVHYEHSQLGYNYRMSNIVAGVGRGQLEVLDQRVKQRRAVFKRYFEAFHQLEGIEFQPELEESMSNRWLTALTIDPYQTGVSRDDIIEALNEENIEARPVWKPMHLQPLYQAYTYYPFYNSKSVSDELFEKGLCLPSGSNLVEEDQERVIQIILNLMS
ncbi:pyridoxal phosphate-dependent aminotransferase EpsN [Alkalibacillus almallahensis]|nr:pyridoxal phosphate-dependent aminotransferase EpsN [Alkalibacillus almallahensis]